MLSDLTLPQLPFLEELFHIAASAGPEATSFCLGSRLFVEIVFHYSEEISSSLMPFSNYTTLCYELRRGGIGSTILSLLLSHRFAVFDSAHSTFVQILISQPPLSPHASLLHFLF